MKIRILGILGGIALLLSAGSVYARSVSGNFGCSSISTNITFDGGANYAVELNCTGHDNFGNYSGQVISAYYNDGGSCTAPDGTPGGHFTLEFSTGVGTYNFNNDQIWAYSFNGSECLSLSGAIRGSTVYTINGGAGQFAGATGTETNKGKGSFLYYPNGAGQTGSFAQITGTVTGTVTP